MAQFQGDAIYWVEVEKIRPNPVQPRTSFDEEKMTELAESVRQYGVLQPLVVTRLEFEKPEGGIGVEYELIAGERRLRASKMANLVQIPVIIKEPAENEGSKENELLKLELAIIENLQREDLTPLDKAEAFSRLHNEFGLTNVVIAKKVGISRERVSNTARLLKLPDIVKDALNQELISEGHARTLLTLNDQPEEQETLLREILDKKLTIREVEDVTRSLAPDKVKNRVYVVDPELVELSEKLSESLGTRVRIRPQEKGGKIMIDFFSPEDVRTIVSLLERARGGEMSQSEAGALERFAEAQAQGSEREDREEERSPLAGVPRYGDESAAEEPPREKEDEGDDLYSVSNFSV